MTDFEKELKGPPAEGASSSEDQSRKVNEQTASQVSDTNHPRQNLPLWKWVSTCIGLYLGALLYGEIAIDTHQT